MRGSAYNVCLRLLEYYCCSPSTDAKGRSNFCDGSIKRNSVDHSCYRSGYYTCDLFGYCSGIYCTYNSRLSGNIDP